MKIVGSDYDGTLTYGGIDEKKLNAIKKWRAAGNKFGLVSGRNVEFLFDLQKQYPQLALDFFAGCNGGYITDGEGKVLHATACNEVNTLRLIEDLLSLGATFVHFVEERYICALADMDNRPFFIAEEKCVLLENLPPLPYFYQVSVELASPSEAAKVVALIKEKYGAKLNPLQNGRCIDIVPFGVNKAEGLYRVMEFFAYNYEDVIAVGDNINDEDMLREFRSYAMENGVDEMKALADGIVRDVTEIFEKEQ